MNNIIKFEEQKTDLQMLRELAKDAVKSGSYQLTESQIFNVMLSARDFGVSPMKAINGGFNVINGKISMSTALMADRIRKDGHSIKIIEWTSQKCVIIGKRKDNDDSVKFEFTMEDAQLAGLVGSATWKKYPKAMLYNRAMSQLARVLFPDVVGNCYSEEEGEEIRKASENPAKEPEIETVSKEVIEPAIIEMTLDEAIETLSLALNIPETDLLKDYIAMCMKNTSMPISRFVDNCIKHPERFKDFYAKWIEKKKSIES